MSENTMIARALVVMVAVVALGVVGVLFGVRSDSAYAQVADRAGNYLAVTGTISGRNEQVLYLIDTREQMMIVYKYDAIERVLYRLAETNLQEDMQQSKLLLETTGPGAVPDRNSAKQRRAVKRR